MRRRQRCSDHHPRGGRERRRDRRRRDYPRGRGSRRARTEARRNHRRHRLLPAWRQTGGGDNDVALRDMGVALTGPAAGAEPARPDPIAAFETTPDLKSVTRCPRGVEPVRVKHTKRNDTVVALFDKETCRACDLRGECGAKRHKKHYTLTFTRSRMATALRREHEKTEAFKKTYAIRAGIEGTNSELKRAHGMGRLRVRGQPAVEFAVFMKIIACNVKRYIKARIERLRRAAGSGKVAGGAPFGVENAPCGLSAAQAGVLAPVFRLLRLRLRHSEPLAA
ncbi:MAG: transposase [bacterium]